MATSSDLSALKPHIKLLAPDRGIAFVDLGPHDAADVLVLVHGSLCDWRYWTPQLRTLADPFRLVAPSLAHYHPRLPSASHVPFAWSSHVEQLAAFLPTLTAQRLHLIGHSRGAVIAYQLALRHPQSLSSLTLIDPGGRGAGFDGHGNVREQAAALIRAGKLDEGLRAFVDAASQPGLLDRSPPWFRDMIHDNASTLVLQLQDELPGYEEADATSLAVPTLIVDGERSPPAFRDNARKLAAWIPRATPLTLAGASHGMTLTHFQRFNRELAAFIASLAA